MLKMISLASLDSWWGNDHVNHEHNDREYEHDGEEAGDE